MKANRTAIVGAAAVSALAAACFTAPAALAGSTAHGGYIDYADVVAVEPLVRTVRVSVPRQECWDESVTVHEPPARRSYTPEIVGSILGAAVGNQFGSGSGRDIATVAGAVLGGSLGHDVKNRRAQAYGHSYQTVEERCQTVHEEHVEERVDGYDVTYRYNGREYGTRMARDPGETVRVRVSVTPLD